MSLATASRVINGSQRQVAESYRQRVLAAADSLGYTANLSAQATVRGTSSIVGLLVADIADPYFGRIAAGVVQGADESGLVVSIAMTERDDHREARLIRAFSGQRPRGLILAASRSADSADGASASALSAFHASGGTVVTLGRGASIGMHVDIDNYGGGRLLGAELARRGYRDAIALMAPEGVYGSDDRLAGFTAGFAPEGRVARVYRPGFEPSDTHNAMQQAIADGIPAGTLIVGVSDVVAIAAMTALRRAGRRPGDDIAVCGFDDISIANDVTPDLTTVRLPLEEIGLAAVRAVVARDDIDVPTRRAEVIVRGSTPGRAV